MKIFKRFFISFAVYLFIGQFIFAQNIPNQNRPSPQANLEVMTFTQDTTYQDAKKILDEWKIKYDDYDMIYKTAIVFKNSYFKGMAVEKIYLGFDLKTKQLLKVEFNVMENSSKELDAYMIELAKKYPLEKAYNQWTAKNGKITRSGLLVRFEFEKKKALKSEEPGSAKSSVKSK